ncbi:hypothetical protein QFX18_01320 [Saccharophagus degradans]|uniref:hypothetical protein n=1 Tax=Saccharophagus degradans TaxID=86304 RepID=UPI0024780F6E|nr:hypothetical protein [Saccharophagus degradans]WGO98700.1 hypothetical protein QFX18_01320 [Saccharophagus degradans]
MNVFLLQPDFDYKEIDLSPLDIEDIFPENITLESILDFSKHNMALKEFWSAIKVDFVGKSEVQHVPDIGIWMEFYCYLPPQKYLSLTYYNPSVSFYLLLFMLKNGFYLTALQWPVRK